MGRTKGAKNLPSDFILTPEQLYQKRIKSNKYMRDYYQLNIQKRKLYQKDYYEKMSQDPNYRQYRRDYNVQYYKNNKHKILARQKYQKEYQKEHGKKYRYKYKMKKLFNSSESGNFNTETKKFLIEF